MGQRSEGYEAPLACPRTPWGASPDQGGAQKTLATSYSARVRRPNRGVHGFFVVALVAVAAIVVAGSCGVVDDDLPSGSEAGAEATGLRVPDDPGSGCGDAASTEPGDLRPNRAVARCGPGSPAARPLDEDVTLRVAIDEPREGLAPLLLADRLGELAEEGISVELVETDGLREAYEALANDEVDAVAADLHGAFFDIVAQGDGARLVLGGAVPSAADDREVDQAGLWIATHAVSAPNRWRDLEHRPLAVRDGISGASASRLMHVLLQGEVSLNDMNLVPVGGHEAAQQLLAGGVVAAWLEDPHWQLLEDREGFELAATRPQEALGGVVLHERLLDPDEDRDVGLAFVRALIRTVNTDLPADYRDDVEVVTALVETTGWTEEQVLAGSPLVFDWEIRAGTIDRMQAALLPLGAVTFEDHLDEDGFLDRSLYEQAVSD